MDKGLQEVIAKLNQQQQKPQVSQTSTEKPAQVKTPQADFNEENEDETDAEFYEDTEQNKPDEKAKTEMEMELLNNNGRFRTELLFQLQEINKTLVVIAQVLMQKR